MRKPILPALLCALALLAACGKEEPLNWTPTPATPRPTATAAAEGEAPWASLTVDDLPTSLADPNDLFSDDSPQVYLLGCKLSEELYLYGLNDGYGGGILLRQGEELTHFDQAFASPEAPALPELYLTDTDGDGQEELAVRYLMEAQGDRIAYDLHIYRCTEDTWSDLAVTHQLCAQKALEEVETDYGPVYPVLRQYQRRLSGAQPISVRSRPAHPGHLLLPGAGWGLYRGAGRPAGFHRRSLCQRTGFHQL